MSLSAGDRLGSYEILAPLGAGGMGEVYRARDTRLDRTVAIKVLPAHLYDDGERRERFEREARAISSLNHPNICTLHDIGREDGVDFMVMEHIEGETLADCLKRGALPLDRALRHAIEIADALDKAHCQGVVHRDLKPGNIMLTKSGAKLLDFGLAKLQRGPGSAPGSSQLATEAQPLTEKGAVLGTFQYMSPEQLEGREADARTDIFVFGAVLYEMLTGRRAFEGQSQASLIAAILEHDPPALAELQPMTPRQLERVLRRCLAKDPDERWQSADDLATELRWIAERDDEAAVPAAGGESRGWRERWAWGLAAVAGVTALSLGLMRDRPSEPRPTTRFVVDAPAGAAFSYWRGSRAVVSPDGRHAAFVARDEAGERLWVRSLDSLEARPLEGADGPFLTFFWSADSRSLAFGGQDGPVRRIELAGGAPQTLYEGVTTTDSGTWNGHGVILVSMFWSTIHSVPAAGGTPQPLTRLDPARQEIFHRDPQFLPDGERFLFYADSRKAEFRGTYVASLAHPDDRQLILPGRSATYAAPDFLLFTRDGSLIARRFDSERLEMSGEPVVLAESVAMLHGTGHFSASSNGVLVYRADSTPDFQLGWFDREGNELERLFLPEGARNPELSPDGQRLAFERYDPDTGWRDVWLYELDRGVASRFTFDSSTNDSDPVWSPDGREIIFSSSRGGYPSLYRKGTGGSVDAELIHEASDGEEWPMSWSSDGQHLVYNRWSNDTSSGRLWLLSLSAEGQAELLLASEFEEVQAQFSPDGRWISYSSNESGSQEVYVERFPRTGEKWRISAEGGSNGRWRGDGQEIFYLAPDRRLMAVHLNLDEGTLRPSRPQALFQTGAGGPLGTGLRFSYAVADDGQRFLIHTATGQSRPAPIVVVLNWSDELKAKTAEAGE